METFLPSPPFVWPEPRVLAGLRAYRCDIPFDALIRQAHAVFGVVRDVNEQGVAWLKDVLCSNSDVQSRLLIAVYPACTTHEADLMTLAHLHSSSGLLSSVEFRVLTVDNGYTAPANLLCWMSGDPAEPYIALGPTSGWGLNTTVPIQANLVMRAGAPLLGACRRWFDYVWEQAVPLTAETACIPPLIPARGTPEAVDLWAEYVALCEQAEKPRMDGTVSVDALDGMVTAHDFNGKPTKTATASLLGEEDTLAAEIESIYSRGAQVTIDRTTRLKPFDTPIDPFWFGMKSFQQVGNVSRRVSYRISPFEERTLKELNNLRSRVSALLPRFTFPLGDNVRWMPTAARRLFEEEMTHADRQGRERFKQICDVPPDVFVANRTEKILKDANHMYQELYPNQMLGEQAIREIVDALSDRLRDVADSPFTPKVSYTTTGLRVEKDTEHTSAWGQELTLLYAVAEFPRRCVADRFFLRGLNVREEALLSAMNVADDAFVGDLESRGLRQRAEDELDRLKSILHTELPARVRCKAILALLRGQSEEAVDALLAL